MNAVALIESLDAREIEARLAEGAAQQQALRALLRATRARERAQATRAARARGGPARRGTPQDEGQRE